MKKLLILSVFGIFCLVPFTHVSAHILAEDGNVSALLHVDPNDNPGTNSTSTLHFLFQKGTPDFVACGCTVTVSEASTTLFAHTIESADVDASTSEVSLAYRFPAFGTYTIAFRGLEPMPFVLSYTVGVDSVGGTPDDDDVSGMHMTLKEHGLHILVFGLGFLAILYVILKPEPEKRA